MSPVALLALATGQVLPIAWNPTKSALVLVGFTPWLGVLIVAGLLNARASRSGAERQWATNPAFRRTLTADVSDAGIWTTDGQCDTLYRWSKITKYRETDALLLLTLEDTRVLPLPKRCVPDESALRSLIHAHVAEGTFLRRGTAFPVAVLPLAAGSE